MDQTGYYPYGSLNRSVPTRICKILGLGPVRRPDQTGPGPDPDLLQNTIYNNQFRPSIIYNK